MSEPEKINLGFLWKSFLKGDDKSFSLIYQQHIDSLFLYGTKLCADRDLVRDSIQEIFVDLYLKRKKAAKEIVNLKSYLFVSLRNSVLKKRDKTRKLEPLGTTDGENGEPFLIEYNFLDRYMDLENSKKIKEQLLLNISKLPARQKEIIYLKFEEELDYSEIAPILKISIESARKLLYRALITIRKSIDPTITQTLFLIFLKKNRKNVSMFQDFSAPAGK